MSFIDDIRPTSGHTRQDLVVFMYEGIIGVLKRLLNIGKMGTLISEDKF